MAKILKTHDLLIRVILRSACTFEIGGLSVEPLMPVANISEGGEHMAETIL